MNHSTKKLTTDKFISKCILIHGEKYDYSKVNYKQNKSKIIIICKKHGEFLQTPNSHLNGNGCRICAFEKLPQCNPNPISEFIEKANCVHNNRYKYTNSIYINRFTDISIVCQEHGEFFQSPNNHLSGAGCPYCAIKARYKCRAKTIDDFILEAKEIHGDRYDYSESKYENIDTNIIIICSKHGEFLQSPYNHLNGSDCPKCKNKISKSEVKFLNYVNVPESNRQKYIKPYRVDGIDGNIIYEFLGDYYHGNPNYARFGPDDYNKTCHKTYGQLYDETMNKFKKLKDIGYNVKYIWEMDWKRYEKGIDKEPKIIEYFIN